MLDINLIEVQQITNQANNSVSYLEEKHPYLSSYETLNKYILKAAKEGKNSISFDFVDSDENEYSDLSLKEIEKDKCRVYLIHEKGQAYYNTFNYPLYLISKGFNVETRKSIDNHGYRSKSYYISW